MKPDKSSSAPRDTAAAAMVTVSGNGGPTGSDPVSVDKIRDLLFGNQMQDYDRRFANLEERFLQRFRDIESETARNLGAFESNAKKQVDSLATQLRTRTVAAGAGRHPACRVPRPFDHPTPGRRWNRRSAGGAAQAARRISREHSRSVADLCRRIRACYPECAPVS